MIGVPGYLVDFTTAGHVLSPLAPEVEIPLGIPKEFKGCPGYKFFQLLGTCYREILSTLQS